MSKLKFRRGSTPHFLCGKKNKSCLAFCKKGAGFTLIELLIVIAIISIIAAVVYVALDPLARFQDARNSNRWTDVAAIICAIKIHQVDNGGSYLSSVATATSGEVFMITDGVVTTGCDVQNANCETPVASGDGTDDDNCVDLSSLVSDGYLARIPVSPNGDGSWTSTLTGYTLSRSDKGILSIRACEREDPTALEVVVAR